MVETAHDSFGRSVGLSIGLLVTADNSGCGGIERLVPTGVGTSNVSTNY